VPRITRVQKRQLSYEVDFLELSVRATNVLEGAAIRTVRDLVTRTPRDLLALRQCGKKTLNELESRVKELGFTLGMDLGT